MDGILAINNFDKILLPNNFWTTRISLQLFHEILYMPWSLVAVIEYQGTHIITTISFLAFEYIWAPKCWNSFLWYIDKLRPCRGICF